MQVHSSRQWHALLRRFETLTDGLDKIPVGYDDVAEFARSKFHTRITSVSTSRRSGDVRVDFAGEAKVPLMLTVFRDQDDTVERSYEPIEPFAGRATVTV